MMRIYFKEEKPKRFGDIEVSMHVFIYYKNNKRFCIGRYDFTHDVWYDSDGMPIEEDFLWTTLPVKQMKAFLRIKQENNISLGRFEYEEE